MPLRDTIYQEPTEQGRQLNLSTHRIYRRVKELESRVSTLESQTGATTLLYALDENDNTVRIQVQNGRLKQPEVVT